MSRPAQARIDLSALRGNYLLARQAHGGRALAVVKANAYGHGALRCAQALQALADGFAVAFLHEALALRQGGISAPILVLEGAFSPDELLACAREHLWVVVHHERQLAWLEQAPAGHGPWNVWLKVDTGMHRLGFRPAEVAAVRERLRQCRRVADVVLMTHLGRADETVADVTASGDAAAHDTGAGATATQVRRLAALRTHEGEATSLANSAAILAWPAAHGDWARPGLMLYGVHPCQVDPGPLQPVMELCSEVFAERWVGPGAAIGYGRACRTSRRTRVGLVALGYADGYPRHVGPGTQVALPGGLATVLGHPCMDMLAIDLTDHPDANPGTPVELWGRQLPVARLAQQAGTVAYELLCRVSRVPLTYHASTPPALRYNPPET